MLAEINRLTKDCRHFGGLIDGSTIAKGLSMGLDSEHSLAKADSGNFLEQTQDLISTGPTGTNVMDLMIGLKT